MSALSFLVIHEGRGFIKLAQENKSTLHALQVVGIYHIAIMLAVALLRKVCSKLKTHHLN